MTYLEDDAETENMHFVEPRYDDRAALSAADAADIGDERSDRSNPAPKTKAKPTFDPPIPRIATRDNAIRNAVRTVLIERPELRSPQYTDLLVLKTILRRHYNRLNEQLTRDGVLTKAEGKVKAALGSLLDIAAEMRRIDAELPAPPPPEQRPMRVEIVAVCPNCQVPSEDAENLFDEDRGYPLEIFPKGGGAPFIVPRDDKPLPAATIAPETHADAPYGGRDDDAASDAGSALWDIAQRDHRGGEGET